MRHSSVAAVGTTWLRLVEGIQGWTALPRLAAWLCVPAIIAGAAAGASQIAGAVAPTISPFPRAIVGSAGGIAVLFGMVGMLTTPVAALLVLILSLLRRWRLQVLGVLWLLVTVAMGITFPAVDAAMRNWMVLQGAQQDP